MSRIGKQPIPIPPGVEVILEDRSVTVKGPKGVLTRTLRPEISVRREDSLLRVERKDDSRLAKALHGLSRTLIANMIQGVTEGYQKVLEVHGVGYRAQMVGKKLQLNVGYSHPVEIDPPPGIEFEVGQDPSARIPLIYVRGIDKELVGQVAANIRAVRKPEPYKGKGIRYQGEQVRRKAGKSAKAGGKGR